MVYANTLSLIFDEIGDVIIESSNSNHYSLLLVILTKFRS